MIQIQTNETRILAEELRDGDWVIADLDGQLVLARYQDSLVHGNYRPVLLDEPLLEQLGFSAINDRTQENGAIIYQLDDGHVHVVNSRDFIFEGGEKGRLPVAHLHLLQQIWRQTFDAELITDFLEQPSDIISL